MSSKRIIIIGGSAAGPKTASKARRMDQNAEIILFQKEKDLSMASCGFPYYVGGVFDDRNQLLCTPTGVTRDPDFFVTTKNIIAKTETEIIKIDKTAKIVIAKDLKTDKDTEYSYDKLVICTGATSFKPPIPGIDAKGISALKTMSDADFLRKIRDEKKIKKAIIIGGGLIGIETCEALQLAGIKTAIIELQDQILPFLDYELAKKVENYMKSLGVEIITSNGVSEFIKNENNELTGIKLQDGKEISCELAVVSIGVRPASKLAKEAGLKITETGAVWVDEYMQTDDPHIYSAGDCVETKHLITGKNVYSPMGDLANLQGRVIGENLVKGNKRKFKGVLQTGICKVFEYSAGATGLSKKQAIKAGYNNIETVVNAGPYRPGFMGATVIVSKLVVNKDDRRILGYQCICEGDISKQIGMAAMAITGKLTIDDISNADLPYAPPFSLAIEHFIVSCHIIQNKIDDGLKGITSVELKKRLDNNEKPFLIDLRGPDEYEMMRLGIGEKLIPLGKLKNSLDQIPQDKNTEIICFCKISLRGYEASLILKNLGWTNVSILEGGIMGWPFDREK